MRYEEHGRHEIFAGGKKVNMEDKEHALYLREEELSPMKCSTIWTSQYRQDGLAKRRNALATVAQQ